MRWRTVVLVWVFAALCLGAAWLVHADNRPSADTAGRLHVAAIDRMDAIDLIRDDMSWSYARHADGWWQTQPFRHRMHADLLLALPEAVQATEVLETYELDDPRLPSLATLGLDPPTAIVRLGGTWNGDRVTRVLHLGRRGLAGRAWAAEPGSGQVVVVDGAVHSLLDDEPPEGWRDLRLFPDVSVDADVVSRTVSGETLTLERDGRRWRITAPLATRADASAVMQHVSELAGSRATAVLLDEPPDLAAFGLSPPLASVHVRTGDDTRTVHVGARLGGASQDRYAIIEGVPSVVQIEAADVTRLLGNPTMFVDHMGTDVRRPDVAAVRVMAGEGDVTVHRAGDRWHDSAGTEIPTGGVTALLDAVLATRAEDVALRETYPRELEQAVITLIGDDGGPLDTVRVLREPGPPAGRGRWALENGDHVLRILPEGAAVPFQSLLPPMPATP